MSGPYASEREARESARRYPAGALPGDGLREANLSMLMDAVIAAGVPLGAWDSRIVEWLASFEPSTCAVIASLITRAHQAGRSAAQGGEPAS